MATPSAFLQTVLGAFTKQSAVLQPSNRALEWVTADIGFDKKPLGATVDVPIMQPVDTQVVVQQNVGYTAPTYNAYTFGFVPVKLNTLISYSAAVPSIDQLNTEENIIRLLVDPALKGVENQANAVITSLFTPANFGVNAPISTTGSVINPADFIKGKTALDMQFVDTDDMTNVGMLMAPQIYNNLLVTPAWSQNYFVGEAIAVEARMKGVTAGGFGASFAKDQKMPVSGTTPNQVFTSFLGTKQAIAAAYRPVPCGDDKYVDAAYINYKGLLLLVEISYLGKDRQRYLNVMGVMGAQVVRPEQGQIFTTAQ